MKLALSWEATVPFRSRSSGPTRVAQSPARPSITDHQTEVPRTAPDQASAALGSYARTGETRRCGIKAFVPRSQRWIWPLGGMLPHRVESFEAVVLPHMRAGYDLARCLFRNA